MLTPYQANRRDSHIEFFEGIEREPGASSMAKTAVYLFNAANIGGYLHHVTPEERDELLAGGEWFDTPAGLEGAKSVGEEQKHSGGTGKPLVNCPHCGKPLYGDAPADGGAADSELLAKFKDGKKMTKQELAALGQELGIVLVADDLTAKQMAEEIQTVLDTPPLA
jgi:hypothetical protein